MRHSRCHSSRVSPTSGHRLPCKVTARSSSNSPLIIHHHRYLGQPETQRSLRTPSLPVAKDAVRSQLKAHQGGLYLSSICLWLHRNPREPGQEAAESPAGPHAPMDRLCQGRRRERYITLYKKVIESPPFEVSETGWGEFEIQIKIFFVPECTEKAQTLFHFLKLHPYIGDKAELELSRTQRRPVQAFIYDEIIFNEPTEAMYDLLTSRGSALIPPRARNGRGWEFTEESEASELDRLTEGIKVVQEHIKKAKETLLEKERQVAQIKAQLEKK